jgi:hypothetical protein
MCLNCEEIKEQKKEGSTTTSLNRIQLISTKHAIVNKEEGD